MIAEIIPEAYDAVGKKVFQPFERRQAPHPTFPMGRYLSQPLTVKCESIQDIRRFLTSWRAVPDEEQFGKLDYWQPPEHFEQTRKGDCEDFALWTWRQFLALGYDARFVGGPPGRYGIGHAWVTFESDGKHFLVEPQLVVMGETFPRLSTLNYHPKLSVSWDGEKIVLLPRRSKVQLHHRPDRSAGV
jgi:transglutaminase superfamily protein